MGSTLVRLHVILAVHQLTIVKPFQTLVRSCRFLFYGVCQNRFVGIRSTRIVRSALKLCTVTQKIALELVVVLQIIAIISISIRIAILLNLITRWQIMYI